MRRRKQKYSYCREGVVSEERPPRFLAVSEVVDEHGIRAFNYYFFIENKKYPKITGWYWIVPVE